MAAVSGGGGVAVSRVAASHLLSAAINTDSKHCSVVPGTKRYANAHALPHVDLCENPSRKTKKIMMVEIGKSSKFYPCISGGNGGLKFLGFVEK